MFQVRHNVHMNCRNSLERDVDKYDHYFIALNEKKILLYFRMNVRKYTSGDTFVRIQ